MTRFLFPVIGIVLLAATVAQVGANRARTAPPRPAAPHSEPARIVAEGRLVAYPDAQVTVASDADGTVDRLAVYEKDVVHRGDVIAVIRADDTRAALRESQARVAEADADIRLFEVESARTRNLWEQAVGSKQAWEKADRDLDAARARRASAIAEVNRLTAMLAKTVVKAPIDGTVVSRNVEKGERIESGQPIVTLANLSRTRVEAEVDEFDIVRVKLGAPVKISAEGFDDTWRGTIEEIPDTVISRRLKPQDPSRPIDTRVLLVKIALAEPSPLKLGQRVDVQILSPR
ncbi:MAG TPA: efflux RND transporter periplasmic adaptor subunit [Thermoanaerobaculia bacterium]|nr:efflux RND transporter periplasmic adaptor subunit [Thermoanaerobaculia bacterium]